MELKSHICIGNSSLVGATPAGQVIYEDLLPPFRAIFNPPGARRQRAINRRDTAELSLRRRLTIRRFFPAKKLQFRALVGRGARGVARFARGTSSVSARLSRLATVLVRERAPG